MQSTSSSDPVLRAVVVLFLAAFVAALLGLVLDARIITGAPAWLKPAKFAISTAIYLATIGWLARWITVWPGLVKAMGRLIALVLVVEDVIIFAQAWRGTASHFNISTTVDLVLFGIMGSSIAVLWLASAVLTVALFRSQFADVAWGSALKWGMAISLAGAGMGGLMVPPTPEQQLAMQKGDKPTKIGSHTVGAPDGGLGLAGVGWSTVAGDLRIPHFHGLHAIQLLPLAVWVRRRRSATVRSEWVLTLAASYAGLTGILLWQALRAEPLIHPGNFTIIVFMLWMALSVSGLAFWAHQPKQRENFA